MDDSVDQLAADLYDLWVPDWPGEVRYYRELATQAQCRDQAVLEIACGTGRITLKLADLGVSLVGTDLSPEMLQVAFCKSQGVPNVRWVQADMRAFDLGQTFGLVILPGHSFQYMLTPEDQRACLDSIARHLAPGGRLVLHLDAPDVNWLGQLVTGKARGYQEAGKVVHPLTGRAIRISRAWSYLPASQTARVETVWEELDAAETVVRRWQRGAVDLHCAFPFEMEHLLRWSGFTVQGVYGSFEGDPFCDDSDQMIWVARR